MANNQQQQSGMADQATQIALEKLLASPLFAASPRQQSLLRYLARQSFSGNAERLKGYVIGVEVFGRGTDFDPAVDAIVRVEAGRLRSRLREYYLGEGQADPICFELPKGSYALRIIRPGTTIVPSQSGNSRRSGLDDKPTLAVLPLANLSPEPGQDYFADGLTDSLIFELSRLSGLLVISRQSSFAYRSSSKTLEAIANELGVKYLLEGSVQRNGTRVRVNLRLIEASSSTHILSERFEGDMQDIFALQDSVTLGIVKALQIRLAPADAELFGHEGTGSVEAHEELLRGLECHWKFSPQPIAEACRHFARAVECDPGYAAAHAWLARSMLHQWIMKWDKSPARREQAMQHALKAVEFKPDLPYAHSILGWVNLWIQQREEAMSHCRLAVTMDPNNPEALNFLSMVLSAAGFGEEALYYSERARHLNPHSSAFYEYVLGQAYLVLEDYDQAIVAYKRGYAMNENFIPNLGYLCITYALLGMVAEMKECREKMLGLLGGDKSRVLHPPWLDQERQDFYQHMLKLAELA